MQQIAQASQEGSSAETDILPDFARHAGKRLGFLQDESETCHQ